ncbi:unnamed protein product [Alternaria alternata]
MESPPTSLASEKERQVNVVDWHGNDDAANPRNFASWKKTINIACIFFMSFVSRPFTSSVVAPAIPEIMKDFRSTDAYLSAFVLSIYVLGYAFGPLLISPLSEQYGRLPLYHLCNVLFTICTLACGRANSLGVLAVFRFLAGVGGSSVFALAPSSLGDLMVKEKRGGVMALIGLAYNLGPAISPTAGSYLNAAKGWRWIFYLTAILGGIGTVLSMLCLSETYEPVLLRRKTVRLRNETGNENLRARPDVDTAAAKLEAFGTAMFMPLRMLFLSHPIFFTSLLTAIGYGYIYVLYTTLPTTFVETYKWAPKSLGLAYLGTAVGNLIGMLGGAAISDGLVKRRALKGDTRPENRLLPMIFWWPLVSIGLFIYAWTAQHGVHWIAPLIGTAIFGAGAMSAIFFTGPRVYRSANTPKESVSSIPGTMKIIIGPEPEPNNQRTWYLPKEKLSRYSHIFKSIIAADDTVSEVELPTISPNSFAEFVSFMHSNIYSTNTQVAGYRGIRAHADSCLLAAKLEADEYWEAAMRKLYDLFLPLAKSRRSDAKQSLIRADDIAYICINTTEENLRRVVTINSEPLTSDNPLNPQIKLTTDDGTSGAPPAPPKRGYHSHDVGAMKGLRTLFFDALASHWTRSDVIYIGAQDSPHGGGSNKNDVPGDSTTWRQVCDMYPDFHFHIAKTSDVQHWWRTSLLKNINTYLNPVGIQFVGGPGGESSRGAVVKKEAADKIKIKVEEAEADEELEMEPATRRPRLTLRLEGSNGSTSGDEVDYL